MVMQMALQRKDVQLMCAIYGQPQMQHIRSSPRPVAAICWYRCAFCDPSWPILAHSRKAQLSYAYPNAHDVCKHCSEISATVP